jgi:hypothetical protein
MSNHNYLPSDDQNPDFVGASNPDNRLHAVFEKKAVHNAFKSEQAARPIYDDVDMVTIHVPGDKDLAVVAIVREDHKRRFPQQWAIYSSKSQGDQIMVGKTPLEHWARLTVGQVAELKHMRFLSVEDIAHASDTQLQTIGMCGGMSSFAFRDAAVRFLKLAADEAVATKSEAAVAEAKAETAELRAQMEAQMAAFEQRFAALAAAQPAAAAPAGLDLLAQANAAAPTAPQKRTSNKES